MLAAPKPSKLELRYRLESSVMVHPSRLFANCKAGRKLFRAGSPPVGVSPDESLGNALVLSDRRLFPDRRANRKAIRENWHGISQLALHHNAHRGVNSRYHFDFASNHSYPNCAVQPRVVPLCALSLNLGSKRAKV